MHVCIYGVYYKHIYPACSLSHNDRKLFCLLSHAAAAGPKMGTSLNCRYVAGSFRLHFWLIALYVRAQRMRVPKCKCSKPQKYEIYVKYIYTKNRKTKGKRKGGIGIDHHLAAFDDQHSPFLSLTLSLSLSLCVSVSVCRLRQQMLIIKSKIFGIGLRTGTDREMVIAPRSHETIITSSRARQRESELERASVVVCQLPTQGLRTEDRGSTIDNRWYWCIIKFKQIKLPLQQRKQKSSCTLRPPESRGKWNNLLAPVIERRSAVRSTYTHIVCWEYTL